MPRKPVDVDSVIARVEALGAEYRRVAVLAKVGQAVMKAIQANAAVPRARGKANGHAKGKGPKRTAVQAAAAAAGAAIAQREEGGA